MKFWITEVNHNRLLADPTTWLYGAFHLYEDCSALTKRGVFGKPVEQEAEVDLTEKHWTSYVKLNGVSVGYVCAHCSHREGMNGKRS